MFSRFKRFDRPGYMQVIGKWIINSVNVGVSEQFFVRAIHMGNAQLRCRSCALFQVARYYGIKFDVFALLHGGNNFADANIGSTEDSPAYLVHDTIPFLSEIYISELLE